MAIITITPTKIPLSSGEAIPTFTAISSTAEGGKIKFTGNDLKTAILIKNANATAAKTVTFKSGDGLQGVSDLTVSLASGEIKAFALESGKFKMTSGVNNGYVLFTGESTDIQATAFLMP